MKKLLTALFVLLLLTAPFALAEATGRPTTYTSGDWKYILLPDGTAEIVDYTGDATVLTVPADLDGYAVTSIGDSAFFLCTSLTSITLPDSLTSIGDLAFSSCRSLTTIMLPDSVTSIGANPFARCNKLTDIIVSPEHPTLATIGGVLFYKPEKLLVCYPCAFTADSYAVPQGIRIIGDSAFYWCDSLTNLTLPDSVTTIGDRAFSGCESLTSLTLPDSVTSIGDYAFSGCESLTSITLPDSVTSIGNSAFRGCDSLTSITLPDSVTAIGDSAFSDCWSLTSITLPDSVTSIGKEAFNYCGSLTSITLPDTLTTIGDNAFSGCTSLTSITLPDSLTSIGVCAFSSCHSLTSITLPDSVTSIGANPFSECGSLTAILVSPEHPTLESIDGVLFDKVEKRLLSYPWGREESSYVVPEGTRIIAAGVFEYERKLRSITLPSTLTEIGLDEVLYSGYYTLTIPRNTWLTDWCKKYSIPYTYTDSLDWLLE